MLQSTKFFCAVATNNVNYKYCSAAQYGSDAAALPAQYCGDVAAQYGLIVRPLRKTATVQQSNTVAMLWHNMAETQRRDAAPGGSGAVLLLCSGAIRQRCCGAIWQ